MNESKRILVTGGAGFIGSHLLRLLVNTYPTYTLVNLDALTYAGHPENLSDLDGTANYHFVHGDITDVGLVRTLFREHGIDTVIHLAAESHVDRSISDPLVFIKTNVLGTASLLQVANEFWVDDREGKRFHHVSTDEVWGSLGRTGRFSEQTAYDPRSPYSASKAGSDHLVRSWGHTYGIPVLISNCSNNYGPYQHPEKLIPVCIERIRNRQSIPVYGAGTNVRDWLYVEDHARAIDLILHRGRVGETYAVGGQNEWQNIDLVRLICRKMDERLGRTAGSSESLITFVTDRPGHDLRYAIDAGKIREELGWSPDVHFEEGISQTIDWYLRNQDWISAVT